jgi:hypothetical protein
VVLHSRGKSEAIFNSKAKEAAKPQRTQRAQRQKKHQPQMKRMNTDKDPSALPLVLCFFDPLRQKANGVTRESGPSELSRREAKDQRIKEEGHATHPSSVCIRVHAWLILLIKEKARRAR